MTNSILFDGRSLGVMTPHVLIGLKRDDDPERPFMAVAINESRRFKGVNGARRWFARQMGIGVEKVVINDSQDIFQGRQTPTNL